MSRTPNPYLCITTGAWDDLIDHVKDYDVVVLQQDLTKLVKKMRAAYKGKVKWGTASWYERVEDKKKFCDWWYNVNITHRIDAPRLLRPRYTSFRRTPATYRHDDVFLLALLRDAQERRDYEAADRRAWARRTNTEPSEDEDRARWMARMEEEEGSAPDFEQNNDLSGTNVDVAWRSLCWFFYEDTEPQRLLYGL